MQRPDPFTTVHKGLRTALFETSRHVARTDFGNPSAAGRAVAAVRKLIGFSDEHAAHEDRVAMPEIGRLGPAVFAELHADHSRLDGLQREIENLVDRISREGRDERLSLGRRLHASMGQLVAGHLEHMDREETRANRILWAHLTDEELLVLHRAVVSSIPPVRMAEWAEIIIPSVNPEERTGLIAGLQKILPPETLTSIIALAEGEQPGEGVMASAVSSSRQTL